MKRALAILVAVLATLSGICQSQERELEGRLVSPQEILAWVDSLESIKIGLSMSTSGFEASHTFFDFEAPRKMIDDSREDPNIRILHLRVIREVYRVLDRKNFYKRRLLGYLAADVAAGKRFNERDDDERREFGVDHMLARSFLYSEEKKAKESPENAEQHVPPKSDRAGG